MQKSASIQLRTSPPKIFKNVAKCCQLCHAGSRRLHGARVILLVDHRSTASSPPFETRKRKIASLDVTRLKAIMRRDVQRGQSIRRANIASVSSYPKKSIEKESQPSRPKPAVTDNQPLARNFRSTGEGTHRLPERKQLWRRSLALGRLRPKRSGL